MRLLSEQEIEDTAAVNRFLTTLRRIPDEIVLSVASREMEMSKYARCLCGATVREYLVAFNGCADWNEADTKLFGTDSDKESAKLFGGTHDEWRDVYIGVLGQECPTMPAEDEARKGKLSLIEEAFTLRVMEAVEASLPPSRSTKSRPLPETAQRRKK